MSHHSLRSRLDRLAQGAGLVCPRCRRVLRPTEDAGPLIAELLRHLTPDELDTLRRIMTAAHNRLAGKRADGGGR
jgi:hypothetical protein